MERCIKYRAGYYSNVAAENNWMLVSDFEAIKGYMRSM